MLLHCFQMNLHQCEMFCCLQQVLLHDCPVFCFIHLQIISEKLTFPLWKPWFSHHYLSYSFVLVNCKELFFIPSILREKNQEKIESRTEYGLNLLYLRMDGLKSVYLSLSEQHASFFLFLIILIGFTCFSKVFVLSYQPQGPCQYSNQNLGTKNCTLHVTQSSLVGFTAKLS